ncbi:NUDIX hydrolase [Angustibacter luteus]|uniref:NUDIX domain-containing protein n=1 Tax=Angustibacter luteus TaxID=658456 RepID=A0ABW1JA37_9ACTN
MSGRTPSTRLADTIGARPVSASAVVYPGKVWDVVSEDVDLGRAGTVTREIIRHPGAVGVLALDDEGRVALVHQYRHPVGMTLWELPAGLLDVEGEPPLLAAQRELAEEADLRAGRWDVLLDWVLSPGGSTEAFRCYLARDLSPVPEADRHQRDGEELDMPTEWFDLDEVHTAVLANRLNSPSLVVGVLAAHASRALGWSTVKPADSPWPEHPKLR